MDEVPIGLWVVFPETDGCFIVEVVNDQLDPVSLISSCTGNGSLSVHDNVMHQQTVKVPLCSLGYTRPGHKIPGLNSEGAVWLYCGSQVRTVNLHPCEPLARLCAILSCFVP